MKQPPPLRPGVRRFLPVLAVLTALVPLAGCDEHGGKHGRQDAMRHCHTDEQGSWAHVRKPVAHRTSARKERKDRAESDVDGDGYGDLPVHTWGMSRIHNGHRTLRYAAALGSSHGVSADRGIGQPRPSRWKGELHELRQNYGSEDELTADVDDDGHADILVDDWAEPFNDYGSRTQRVIWGGKRGFRGAGQLPAAAGHLRTTGDFNGDGRTDVLAMRPATYNILPGKTQCATVFNGPLRHDGSAAHTHSFDVSQSGNIPADDAFSGDFDGDGRDDLVVRTPYEEEDADLDPERDPENPDHSESSHSAEMYRGTSDGLVRTGGVKGVSEDYGGYPEERKSVGTGDFDGDGRDDLLVRRQVSNTVEIHYGGPGGIGTGKPVARVRLPHTHTIRTGDINGDGREDLVTDPNGVARAARVAYGTGHGLRVARSPVPSPKKLYREHRKTYPEAEPPHDDKAMSDFPFNVTLRDLNGDGRAEVIVDQLLYEGGHGGAHANAYWVLRGSPKGVSAKDARFLVPERVGLPDSR